MVLGRTTDGGDGWSINDVDGAVGFSGGTPAGGIIIPAGIIIIPLLLSLLLHSSPFV